MITCILDSINIFLKHAGELRIILSRRVLIFYQSTFTGLSCLFSIQMIFGRWLENWLHLPRFGHVLRLYAVLYSLFYTSPWIVSFGQKGFVC
jgi:hypothetical protein